MNVAIITARGDMHESLPDKNLVEVASWPLITYPLMAANSEQIKKIFVSTNSEKITKVVREFCPSAFVINRPPELSEPDTNHGDVIRHAVKFVDDAFPGRLENVVVLLGNTVMVDSALVDRCLIKLQSNEQATGVMTVWKAADDHPYRSMRVDEDGMLKEYEIRKGAIDTNRQSYEPAYYYDQGVWAFRKEYAYLKEGPQPWWWMGKSVLPVVREWSAGRDVHNEFDLEVAEWWIRRKYE